jgi:hypothetical protein
MWCTPLQLLGEPVLCLHACFSQAGCFWRTCFTQGCKQRSFCFGMLQAHEELVFIHLSSLTSLFCTTHSYGSCPATLAESPGTRVSVHINWLTSEQLQVLSLPLVAICLCSQGMSDFNWWASDHAAQKFLWRSEHYACKLWPGCMYVCCGNYGQVAIAYSCSPYIWALAYIPLKAWLSQQTPMQVVVLQQNRIFGAASTWCG